MNIKSRIKLWPVAALITAALAISLTFSGCSSPQRTAYVTVGSVQVSVETAMAAWNVYVGAQHPPIATELKVKAAYEKYQAAMAAVCDVGAIYAASGVTNATGQTGASAALATAQANAAQANAAQSLSDLVGLLRTIGLKI